MILSIPATPEVATMPGFALVFLLIATVFHGSTLATECVGCPKRHGESRQRSPGRR